MGAGERAQQLRRWADRLTASRALIALLILLMSLQGKQALPTVILLLILGWTTDILDGNLARRASQSDELIEEERTWLSEHDFLLDMVMVYASFLYLVASGYVPLKWAVLYTLIAGIFIIWSRGSKSVTEIFAFPLVALPLLIAYYEEPWAAYLYILWIITALVLYWQRFVGVVREFIEGMRHLLGV